jgi:hypothetical protein
MSQYKGHPNVAKVYVRREFRDLVWLPSYKIVLNEETIRNWNHSGIEKQIQWRKALFQ